jgi:hypothetical protein
MIMVTEATRSGEFLLSEGNGHISREDITVVSGAGILNPGQVLGKVTISGKYTVYNAAATTGEEVAAAILYGRIDATSADATGLAVVRHAEIKANSLTGSDADAVVDLSANAIIVR